MGIKKDEKTIHGSCPVVAGNKWSKHKYIYFYLFYIKFDSFKNKFYQLLKDI